MTPWNSSSRSASRSVPRPVWYFSSMVRSGASRSPGDRPSRNASCTIRCATRSAALGGRVEVPLMVIDVRPSSKGQFMPKINMDHRTGLGYPDETVESLARLVREWGVERVRPTVWERESSGEFPRDLYAEMGQLGFFGCVFEESLGGTDVGFAALAAVAEQLAWVYPPLSAAMNLQAATVPLTIANWGDQIGRAHV